MIQLILAGSVYTEKLVSYTASWLCTFRPGKVVMKLVAMVYWETHVWNFITENSLRQGALICHRLRLQNTTMSWRYKEI